MKPIDLIIANDLHDLASTIAEASKATGVQMSKCKAVETDEAAEALLRRLLCQCAHNASFVNVQRAMAAIGGPTTFDQIRDRVRAVDEVHKREDRHP